MVEAKGLEPSDLLTASQALYQLSYAPSDLDLTVPADPERVWLREQEAGRRRSGRIFPVGRHTTASGRCAEAASGTVRSHL